MRRNAGERAGHQQDQCRASGDLRNDSRLAGVGYAGGFHAVVGHEQTLPPRIAVLFLISFLASFGVENGGLASTNPRLSQSVTCD